MTSQWIRFALPSVLADGAMQAVTVAGRRLLIYRVGDSFYASDRRCTHQGADLLRGYFDACVIECPVHQGRFDVRTGAPLSPPANIALRIYPIKAEGEAFLIEMPLPAE